MWKGIEFHYSCPATNLVLANPFSKPAFASASEMSQQPPRMMMGAAEAYSGGIPSRSVQDLAVALKLALVKSMATEFLVDKTIESQRSQS